MADKLENIILVGFMGTGKSAIAREISRILNFPHVETDDIIEEREGISIDEIFQTKGEPYFRQLETALLEEFTQQGTNKSIISTGGGMPVQQENRALVKDLGYVVWLKTSEEETFKRVTTNKDRPLLKDGDLKKKIHDMLTVRKPIYREVSRFEIETAGLTVSEIACGIIDSASYYFSHFPKVSV